MFVPNYKGSSVMYVPTVQIYCYAVDCIASLDSNSGRVGSGRVRSEWTLASARALRLPPNIVQVFHMLYRTRVLRFSGRIVQDKFKETRQRDEG